MDAIRQFYAGHRTLCLIAGFGISAFLAVIYIFVHPATDSHSPMQWLVLRSFHALTWVALAAAALIALKFPDAPLASRIAKAGLAFYVIFLAVLALSG